jgi:uncharacterized protein YjiS (DUF1127 family)
MVRPQQKEAIMRTATTPHQRPVSLHFQTSAPAASRLRQVIRRWWRTYWERRARKATVLILQSLDDRTLHDIGITPSEIESCVYGGLRDRRRHYDPHWRF